MEKIIPPIDWKRAELLINLALEEDLDTVGDVTTNSVIPEDLNAKAVFLAKEDLVCAGLPIAEKLFLTLGPELQWKSLVREGDFCPKGTIMAEVYGNARKLLTGERTALNFLQRLCGVATASKKYQDAVGDTACRILDTRKTTPGWRYLEKYAVAVGGAYNHRIGLYDRVMLKDNHRELAGLEGAGGITRSVEKARKMYPGLEVEVEVDSLEELAEAVNTGAEYILLDNMDDATMAEAVRFVNGRSKLEASGGITLARIPTAAASGVDFISSGALTHSVKSSDISMDIIVPGENA
ncbi:MAG: carboxylating nicotinate-nucleotide diphosphorylase [Lentisphaeria bacterium]|nr:carboxylating nicotinate-nucleotide diphosphorylase [Lentisphaeria bacterium]